MKRGQEKEIKTVVNRKPTISSMTITPLSTWCKILSASPADQKATKINNNRKTRYNPAGSWLKNHHKGNAIKVPKVPGATGTAPA